MQWTRITFGDVVRAVHQTTKVDAVSNPEHVYALVGQHLATAAQDDLCTVRSVLPVEARPAVLTAFRAELDAAVHVRHEC